MVDISLDLFLLLEQPPASFHPSSQPLHTPEIKSQVSWEDINNIIYLSNFSSRGHIEKCCLIRVKYGK